MVKKSSESDGSSSDEPPKKNIFEVSLNPEDLMCSMYDKIKRRTCTIKPPTTSSRQTSVVAEEKVKVKEPSKKPRKDKRDSDESSSPASDEEKDAKYASQTTASSIDSDDDFARKKKRKSKSPPKKKAVNKEVTRLSPKTFFPNNYHLRKNHQKPPAVLAMRNEFSTFRIEFNRNHLFH